MNTHRTPEEQAEQLKKAVERLRGTRANGIPNKSKRTIVSTTKPKSQKKRKGKM